MNLFPWLLAISSTVAGVAGVAGFDGALVVLAGTIAVLVGGVLLRRATVAVGPTTDARRTVGMRARAQGVAVIAQRDPDAAGHCRARAPGRAPTAAPGVAAA